MKRKLTIVWLLIFLAITLPTQRVIAIEQDNQTSELALTSQNEPVESIATIGFSTKYEEAVLVVKPPGGNLPLTGELVTSGISAIGIIIMLLLLLYIIKSKKRGEENT